jgi:peroxiredoxin
MYEQFKAQGVDEVYCVSVNDAFVMNAWAKELGCTNVKLLADGNADFTHAIGMLCNKQHLGFANRSWRYAMYVDNMTVNESFIEEGYNNCGDDQDPYVESTPENVIQYIETLNR